jgi:hypothetical protein
MITLVEQAFFVSSCREFRVLTNTERLKKFCVKIAENPSLQSVYCKSAENQMRFCVPFVDGN